MQEMIKIFLENFLDSTVLDDLGLDIPWLY